jgi:hypothetical protein
MPLALAAACHDARHALIKFLSPLAEERSMTAETEAQYIVGEVLPPHFALCRKYRECRKV